VSEEKIVLLAAESTDDNDLVNACRQVINNCCKEEIDVEKLASFDLEYIFIQLRRHSVNNIVTLAYRDLEDEKVYKFDVNLDEIKVTSSPDHSNRIECDDSIVIIMKYPTISVAEAMLKTDTKLEMTEMMIIQCVEKVYDADTVYEEYTEAELKEFLNNLSTAEYDKIKAFFETMPKVSHTIEYTNSKGTERKIQLSGLRDFFTYA
jgi:hypothetical protein